MCLTMPPGYESLAQLVSTELDTAGGGEASKNKATLLSRERHDLTILGSSFEDAAC